MHGDTGSEILKVGRLEVRPDDLSATADGALLPLTVREFDLLTAFARRENRIVSRHELYAVVWGGSYRESDRSVDVYVGKLRAKLEDAVPGWRYIHTHHGFGYRFAAERLSRLSAAASTDDSSPVSQFVHESATRG